MKKKPGTILANARGKKKPSQKQLQKAARILGANGGHARAYNLKGKQLSRIGRYGAAIRWAQLNKETTPFTTYK